MQMYADDPNAIYYPKYKAVHKVPAFCIPENKEARKNKAQHPDNLLNSLVHVQ